MDFELNGALDYLPWEQCDCILCMVGIVNITLGDHKGKLWQKLLCSHQIIFLFAPGRTTRIHFPDSFAVRWNMWWRSVQCDMGGSDIATFWVWPLELFPVQSSTLSFGGCRLSVDLGEERGKAEVLGDGRATQSLNNCVRQNSSHAYIHQHYHHYHHHLHHC